MVRDEMVYKTQVYLNSAYSKNPNWVHLNEDGFTGFKTIQGLIRALQIQIGISTPNGTFGPATEEACPTLEKNPNPSVDTSRLVRILQGAMWCKGFSPGYSEEGIFGDETEEGIKRFQISAGLTGSNVNGIVNPMIFKALLNMDAYVLVSSGDPKIREIQMNLNRDYHKWIGLRPTDGRYNKDTNKALIYALQVEEGIAEPNGTFGPATQAALPVLAPGSKNTPFVKIMQYALYCNTFDPTGFTGVFGNGTLAALKNFQSFCMLTADGYCGKQTWMSLLISYGDPDRPGTACDCSTEVTDARAKTLKNNGYKIVGRYIVGGEWKKLKRHESKVLFDNGLRLFPIFQETGNTAGYFNKSQGGLDGEQGVKAALSYGFPENTTIYFAVDFDAVDDEVTSNILPYFRGVKYAIDNYNPRNYKIGVYGARNICSRVSGEGLAVSSFVGDLASGFSGNIGYPLPKNWAFDQIKEYSIGSGEGAIAIDKNICSNRDIGVSELNEPQTYDKLPYFYEQLETLQEVAKKFVEENHNIIIEDGIKLANHYVAQYLRKDNYDGFQWDAVAGPINPGFIEAAKNALAEDSIFRVKDTILTDVTLDIPHFAATYNGTSYLDIKASQDATGWGGDLITLVADALKLYREAPPNQYSTLYEAAKALIGSNKGSFSIGDVLADIDAVNIERKLDARKTTLSYEIRQYYLQGGNKKRFTDFINNRFGSNSLVYDEVRYFVNAPSYDPITTLFVELLKKEDYSEEQGKIVARAFADYLIEQASKE